MTGDETKPEVTFKEEQAALRTDMERSWAIIRQSNDRSGGIAQHQGGVMGFIIALIALVVAIGDNKFTPLAAVFAVIGIFGLLIALVGMVLVMWPRLRGMSREKSVQDYMARIKSDAQISKLNDVANYAQGLRLQRIAFIKERGTQATLVGILTFVLCALTTLAIVLAS